MSKHIVSYVAVLISFVVIDLVWLGWLARATYVSEMGKLLRKDPNLFAAVAFYILYAGGLLFFAVTPGLKSASIPQAFLLGAGLGLVAYGTYDLTNLAVMEGFSLRIALIDIVWGTILSGTAAAIAVVVTSRIVGE